jgi:hypothetical protein
MPERKAHSATGQEGQQIFELTINSKDSSRHHPLQEQTEIVRKMKERFLNRLLPLVLAVMALVVTGCPHNDYTVELKPQGNTIDRTLVFYRADRETAKNGVSTPNYQAFDSTELSIITDGYPGQAVNRQGECYTIHGSFGTSLPNDVGGAGSYTNWSTTLGDAGFYVERFRGNDDIATMTERRFKAADHLTELLLGWSRAELGDEPGYPQLHQFLDRDFRCDLKNASSYLWEGMLAGNHQTNASEEFTVRFGQYLYDRGYFSLDELPFLNRIFLDDSADASAASKWLQRLIARKMGVPDSAPVPSSLNFLANASSVEKSFTNYVVHTDLYRTRLKEWKKELASDPKAKKPDPGDVAKGYFKDLLAVDFNLFGDTPDHLTVKLSLPTPPLHTNGKWDAGAGQVAWSSDISLKTDTNSLPCFCYASWAQPARDFQETHLGRVILSGDDLVQYCLWRLDLDATHAAEWDNFLASLKPGNDLSNQVSSFRFSDETKTNSPISSAGGRDLLSKTLK